MAFAFQKHRGGRWYIAWRDADGAWRRKACTATTRSAAVAFAREVEAKAERQRFGLEARPSPDGGGAWAALVEWYDQTYASVQPNYRRWLSVKARHLTASP